MNYEGLLTGAQHCAGYFTTVDEDRDLLFLLKGWEILKVREAVDEDMKGELYAIS
jgi:hypothetical protein